LRRGAHAAQANQEEQQRDKPDQQGQASGHDRRSDGRRVRGAEQIAGWYSVLEEHLALPFETTVLGVVVKVVRLDFRGDNDIVAICTRGRERQPVPILDLPIPSPRPVGAEWIEAYRRWTESQ
jgi:hypothetical protein